MTTEPETTATTPGTPSNSFFKSLDLCDLIFKQPFLVFRKNLVCFLTIALFASGLQALLDFVFDTVTGVDEDAGYYTTDDNGVEQLDGAGLFMHYVDSVVLYVITCLADGAVVKVVADMYAGQAITSPSPVAYFGTVAFKAVPLVGSCLLIGLAMTLAFLVLLPILFVGKPGALFLIVLVWMAIAVYISLVTFVTYPAIVVEHKGIWDSIQRSIGLTQGHLGQIFLVSLLYSLLQSTLRALVFSATIGYEANGSLVSYYSREVCLFIIGTFFIAITSIVKAVFYFNIRITDEQLTQEKLVEEMGETDAYVKMEEDKALEMGKPTETPVAAVNNEVV